ncbi:MAG: NAD-dependent epimerase/dehydratase family protein [Proteobacteria bacterium]|nr:NAD-dependent epimerase/dehydratase family protein [Pseudomonadota bacterium]NBP15613.1 NAD-dependent epimerase/dehydratase family protein [bacterium]
MKYALVLGAGGFIGFNLVKKLKAKGYWVRGVDIHPCRFEETNADEFLTFDLRKRDLVQDVFNYCPSKEGFDEIYQLAADMGGAGYIFTGANDANIMHNNALINLNVAEAAIQYKAKQVLFSSSACIYPFANQQSTDNPICKEASAYPASPESEYGWEKLFSERMYQSFCKNYGLNIRIARFHNIYGPYGAFEGGREKAPAAICRKVAQATNIIDIWGDGEQTRSFLYIDECLKGVEKLMKSKVTEPINIGSSELVSINTLVDLICKIAGKKLTKNYVHGPQGVRGRNSDNTLIRDKIGWAPNYPLELGLKKTYKWISSMLHL